MTIICIQTIPQASIMHLWSTLNVRNGLLASYQVIQRPNWGGITWNKSKRLQCFNGNLLESCVWNEKLKSFLLFNNIFWCSFMPLIQWINHIYQYICFRCSTVRTVQQLTVLPKYFGGFFDKSGSRQSLPSTENFGNL